MSTALVQPAGRVRAVAGQAPELGRCPHPAVERVYSTRRVARQDGGEAPMDVYIPREEGDLLYSLVRWLRPRTTIEVGLANGLSALFISAALEENGAGRHIAIDPFQRTEWGGAGLELVRGAGLGGRVELQELCSHQALPRLEVEGVRAQFAFVDGAHLFDYVLTDFLCLDRVLDVEGVIAFDDSDWPAVRGAIRYILANREYEVLAGLPVIEGRRPSPALGSRVLRRVAGWWPKLGEKLRAEFVVPDEDLGIRGRCVVLRKVSEDVRDSQSRCHVAF